MPWVLYAVAVVGRLAQALSGHLGYVGDPSLIANTGSPTGQLFAAMTSCGRLALIVAAIDLVRRRTVRRRLTLAMLLSAELVFSALGGMKEDFITVSRQPIAADSELAPARHALLMCTLLLRGAGEI